MKKRFSFAIGMKFYHTSSKNVVDEKRWKRMSVRAKKRLEANKNIKGKAKDYARANNGTFEFKKLLEIQDL